MIEIKRKNENSKKGFTLLELLIVIAIIAILSVVLVLVLNPAEMLRKARDAQRISDLSTLKTALAIYTSTITSPQLDGVTGTANDTCLGGAGTKTIWVSVNTVAGGGETITDTPNGGFTTFTQGTSSATYTLANGVGWLPVNFTAISGGSPISNLPIDPVNDATITTGSDTSTLAAITSGALMYRYACKSSPLTFEIDARLESAAYGVAGSDDRAAKDGGNNAYLFEQGTDLTILPSTNDF
jgi:prepilin-type N-terminal cleavage/methylation domain-containing protein